MDCANSSASNNQEENNELEMTANNSFYVDPVTSSEFEFTTCTIP